MVDRYGYVSHEPGYLDRSLLFAGQLPRGAKSCLLQCKLGVNMGEHASNPQALLAASIPSLLPVGHRVGVRLELQVLPSEGVILVPASSMRTAGDGSVEVLGGEPPEWRKKPDGMEVFELGKPLPPEKCDMVVMLVTMAEDGLAPKILGAGGQQAQGRVSSGPLAIMARVPLVEWQAQHLGALRGQVE